MMGILIVCCLVLPAPAVVLPVEARDSLTTATVVLAIGAALDEVATYRFLTAGTLGEDGYPTRWIKASPQVRAVVQVAADVSGIYLWNTYVGRKWPRVAKAGLYLQALHRFVMAYQGYTRHNRVMARRDTRCRQSVFTPSCAQMVIK